MWPHRDPYVPASLYTVLYYFADGQAALELIHESLPQVIFMDLKQPRENGIELTRKVRHLAPQTKIIMLIIQSPEPEYLTDALRGVHHEPSQH